MKKNLFTLNLVIASLTLLQPLAGKAQATCTVDELKRLDVNYDSPCEGDAVVIDAIRFNINSGTISWFRVGGAMPATAYSFMDQLYIMSYTNQYHGIYAAVFRDFSTSCTDTLYIEVDSLIPAVTPAIYWVQDLCSAVKMKAVNINDTTAANNTYAWMDQNGNFSLFSQYKTTNNYIETVRITNSAGCTAFKSDYMPQSQLQTPTPDSIINVLGGPPQICANNYLRTYYVAPQSGVLYNWTVPSGCTILSGQGTTSINVVYNSTFTSGALSIKKSSQCGSVTRKITIKKGTVATKPSAIGGTATGLCSASNMSYSVVSVSGVSYTWMVPPIATIVSGQGTSQIIVNFPSTNFTGSISVTATNACGTSAARTLSIKAAPSTPTGISGATTVCSGSTGNAYTVTPVASVTNYKWTGPTGSRIIANGITSPKNILTTNATNVIINYGTVTLTSKISVLAMNACGNGSSRTLALTPCVTRMAQNKSSSTQLTLFPNPANDYVAIRFKSSITENVRFVVTDLMGRKLIENEVIALEGSNEFQLDLDVLAWGCYIFQFVTTTARETMQLIKE